MSVAYVDTSSLIAIAFDEPGGEDVATELDGYDRLVSSNLLAAELLATFLREERETEVTDYLARITWILPNRPLGAEMLQVARHGYLKGADLWHLACALFLAQEPEDLVFATLDVRQHQIAAKLGFPVTPIPDRR